MRLVYQNPDDLSRKISEKIEIFQKNLLSQLWCGHDQTTSQLQNNSQLGRTEQEMPGTHATIPLLSYI